MKNTLLLSLAFLLTLSANAFEGDLASICVRPSSNEMYVGGEFKTIFVIDKTDGSEIRRLTTENGALDMQFSQDGKSLLVFDGSNVHFLDPETGAINSSVKASTARLFENAPYFIDADWIFTKSIIVYSTVDGAEVMKYKPEFTPLDAGFNATFTELIILGKTMDIKGEKNLVVDVVEEKEGYNVYRKAYVDQQKDKKGSGFEIVDMATNTSKLKVEIPYETGKSFGLSLSKHNNDYYLACWDMLLRVDDKGLAHPVLTDEATFAYATNSTVKGEKIFVASTKKGFMYNCASSEIVPFDAKENGEFAYSTDFTDDGEMMYMLNKDFTIAVLSYEAKVLNRFKIDNSTGNGFGLYYYNGFSKKEDRDKEAAIINAALTELSLPTVDLEANIGDSELLIGTFEDIEKAEAFQATLKKNGLQYITTIQPIE